MNKIKVKTSERVFQVFNYVYLTVVVLLCLYPVLYCALASVSDSNLLTAHSGILYKPLGFSLAAYGKVFQNPMIGTGYMNTLFVLIVGVILDIVMTSMGAYFLSRKDVLWKKPLMFIMTFTMFFSGGIIPFYLNLKDLHLTNSLWGLIVPFMVSTYNLIIMRTSFSEIPESLIEAAKIDGAGHMRILFSIVLPVSKAILAVMVLYYGVSIWNGWFWASTILRDRQLYPLQVVLREILLQNDTSSMSAGTSVADTESVGMSIKYATIMVATVPILCVYPFLQKYFAKGVMIGSLKE